MAALPRPGHVYVTVLDEDGIVESKDVGPNDYLVLTTERAYVHNIQRHSNGTTILTIKIADPNE